MSKQERVFALVDCNAFFCSCEILFRPELRGKAVGVLSNNDGCFVSRTKELKALGVGMAQPYFQVKNICELHQVHVFSSNFSLYTNISDRVIKVLSRFAPIIEVYSVDEAFLELTGFEHMDLVAYGRLIKETVQKLVGIPVSVGIGRTKTLAKVANHLAKDSVKAQGVVSILRPELVEIALKKTPVREIWGVGKSSAEKLKTIGVHTAFDLAGFKNDLYLRSLLTKNGVAIKEELQGKIRFELHSQVSKKKSIMCSRTMATTTDSLEDLRVALANYVTSAAQRLREQDSLCSSIEVFVETPRYRNTPQHHECRHQELGGDESDTLHLIRYAWKALDTLYAQGYQYQKVGVSLGGIRDEREGQLGLFEASLESKVRREQLMKTVDNINKFYGENIVKSAACGSDREYYAMKRDMKSPNYLLGWSELPKAV